MDLGITRTYDASSIIFTERSEGSEFYIVLSGAVSIEKQTDGRPHQLAIMRTGDFFGEMAIIDRKPRSATAISIEHDTTLMAIDAARFIYLVSQQPGFAMLVMEALSRRQRGVAQDVVSPFCRDNLVKGKLSEVIQIDENCFQLRSHSRSSNAYLLRGPDKCVLVDTALPSGAAPLASALHEIGIGPSDIDLILLTHEHFDHIAAVPYFGGTQQVAACCFAANKIRLRDDFATMRLAFGEPFTPFPIDMEISEGSVINTGQHRLQVVHTPGHSSGGISLIDQNSGLLISGDTVLRGGPIGGVFGSGNISDLIYSLDILRTFNPRFLLPGHGPLSSQPLEDIRLTRQHCEMLLNDSKATFDALHANESVSRILNSYKDLNRVFTRG
jgi:glyoxylase-like metal-dependent hydrolase (beta-lactamase superfamily II)